MAEIDFERSLERMYGQVGELPDAAAFIQAVERRLDRGWRMRRWLIGAAGLVGGLVGASQLIVANVLGRLESASGAPAHLFDVSFNQVAPRLEWLTSVPSGGTVWAAIALAAVAMGFVLTRVIEEI